MQAQPEVIDLCSTTSTSSDEDNEVMTFSPVKPKTGSPPFSDTNKCDPIDVLTK